MEGYEDYVSALWKESSTVGGGAFYWLTSAEVDSVACAPILLLTSRSSSLDIST